MDVKADDVKTTDVKTDDTKNAVAKSDDTKADDVKTDDVKSDDVQADDAKTDDTKTADVKADDSKADEPEEDYKGKYEELSGKYREALCREFIAGENISSEFVRNAVARELSEQGFDLESTEGKESAKAFIEELRKSNPTIFENGKKPIVEFGKKDEGEEKSDKVSDYFYELNPGMKKRN